MSVSCDYECVGMNRLCLKKIVCMEYEYISYTALLAGKKELERQNLHLKARTPEMLTLNHVRCGTKK